MSNAATRRRRLTAGVLAAAMALTVTPILGLTGVAGAAHLETADPVGDGNVCEDAPATDPFTDVTDADPAVDEIRCMVNTEPQITKGTTPTTYSPNASVTRRQMALFLERLADLAEAQETSEAAIQALPAGDGTTPFTDIADEEPEVKRAIDRLHEANIADGVTTTTFVPEANVTRRQMAKFLVKLQAYVAGEDFAPTPTEDYFDDDNGDTGEGELNILAEEGVFIGTAGGAGQHNVEPGEDITRRQMAFVLTRKLEVLFEAGLIDRLFEEGVTPPPGNNQSFAVTGTEAALNEHGASDDRQYSVSGLDDDTTYTIALVPTFNVTDANGNITFADADDDDTDEVSDGRADGICSASWAVIDVVNGSDVSPSQCVTASPVNGVLTFTVDLLGNPGDVPGESVIPVVFVDDNDDLELNVGTTGAPTEDFGIGGIKTWVAPEAEFGEAGEYVVYLRDPSCQFFVGREIVEGDEEGPFRTFYLEDTEWQYQGAVNTAAGITDAQACMWLTDAATEAPDVVNVGDISDGDRAYNPDGAETITFVRDTPYPPTNVRVTVGDFDQNANDSTDNDARVQWTAATGGWIDYYIVDLYRETDTTDCANGVPVSTGNTTTTTQAFLTNLPDDDYCVVVTAVTRTADAGTATESESFSVTVTGEGDTVAPTSIDAFVRVANDSDTVDVFDGSEVVVGDQWDIVFSEAMHPDSDDGSTIRFTDQDGETYQVVCGGNVECELREDPYDWNGDGTAYGAFRVMHIYVTGAIAEIGDTAADDGDPGDGVANYPLTITFSSQSIRDMAGNRWDVAGSPDRVIDDEALTLFAPPSVVTVTGESTTDTFTVAFDENATLVDASDLRVFATEFACDNEWWFNWVATGTGDDLDALPNTITVDTAGDDLAPGTYYVDVWSGFAEDGDGNWNEDRFCEEVTVT